MIEAALRAGVAALAGALASEGLALRPRSAQAIRSVARARALRH